MYISNYVLWRRQLDNIGLLHQNSDDRVSQLIYLRLR
jgi:hypothetical protein